MPDWWPLLQAAKYLGVAPWDLARQPAYWMRWALTAMGAEAEVNEQQLRRMERRSRS